jgi:hypothetical protein
METAGGQPYVTLPSGRRVAPALASIGYRRVPLEKRKEQWATKYRKGEKFKRISIQLKSVTTIFASPPNRGNAAHCHTATIE